MKQIKTLLIAATIFLGANSINAQTKVAHIDFQGLVSKMPEMTAAKAQLDKKSKLNE